MTGEVASLREEIAGLSALLADLTDDAAVGIIDFKDGCGGPPACASPRSSASTKSPCAGWPPSPVRCAPGSPPCNTTADEDFAEALRAAVGADWRPDSELRSIVPDLRQPGPRPSPGAGRRRRPAILARPGTRHTVSAVLVDTSALAGPAYPDTATFMQRVAEAGGGQFVRADENASLSVTILRAVFDG